MIILYIVQLDKNKIEVNNLYKQFSLGGLNYRGGSMVKKIIIANIFGFILHYLLLGPFMGLTKFSFTFGLIPQLTINQGWIWQLFTYMFLHGGLLHLAFNMFALFIFGTQLETKMGSQKFLALYLIAGIGGAVMHMLLFYNSPVPVIGASGAVMGMIIGFAYFFPNTKLLIMGIIPVKAWKLALFYAIFELLSTSSQPTGAVAYSVHLGGIVSSFLVLQLFYKKYKFNFANKQKGNVKPPKRKQKKSNDSKIIELERDQNGWWK